MCAAEQLWHTIHNGIQSIMDYGLYLTKTINQPLNQSCPDFTGVLHISVIANT